MACSPVAPLDYATAYTMRRPRVGATETMRRVVYGGERACFHDGCEPVDPLVLAALDCGGSALCRHHRPLTNPKEPQPR